MSEINNWMRKRHRLIAWLGIPQRQAWFHRDHIDDLASDIGQWRKRALAWVGAALFLLLVLSLAHVSRIHNAIKLAYLVAYSVGLIGTAFAAYGFRSHLKGITERREIILRSFPGSLTSADIHDTLRYTKGLAEFLQDYFEYVEQEEWQRAKAELRKQLALVTGMVLIALSFMIQITLQFC